MLVLLLLLSAGGDSVSAVNHLQPRPVFSYTSTGGGASLELIRGDLLPGLSSLAQAIKGQAGREQRGNGATVNGDC